MINTRAFHNANLFPVPIEEYLQDFDAPFMLYAPLAADFILADEEKMKELSRQLVDYGKFTDKEAQRRLINSATLKTGSYLKSPQETFALTILPNNICNFSCTYCYAAQGHSQTVLEKEKLKAVLDFFIDTKRITRKDLYISFGGGGEPFISWDLVKYAMEYGTELASKYGFELNFSFASNGSIVNDEIVETLKKYRVKANISFDILEDIQNLQRKNYTQVCKTLDILLENDIFPTINSVITPLNVSLQKEMIEHIHSRFPKLKRVSFDAVVNGKLFEKPEELSAFYDTYIQHFFQAYELGKKYHIVVSCIKHHNLELLKSRACAGGFDLTPEGNISMCFFVSSPREALFDEFIYGKVSSKGEITFDQKKFTDLINYSSDKNEQCANCFIQWHCGGGCLYQQKSYDKEMFNVMCRFQRKFSLISLLLRTREFNLLSVK